MSAILALTGLAFTAVALVVTFVVTAVILKFALKLILLPLLLIKWLIVSLVMLIVGPILFIVGLAAALLFGVVLAVPLLPLLAVGALVWMSCAPRALQSPLD